MPAYRVAIKFEKTTYVGCLAECLEQSQSSMNGIMETLESIYKFKEGLLESCFT